MFDAISVSTVATGAIATLADRWHLSDEELRMLIGCELSPDALDNDTLKRISHLLIIYKTLLRILPTQEAAETWIRRTNSAPLFEGQCALDYMLDNGFNGIVAVREYLDAEATR